MQELDNDGPNRRPGKNMDAMHANDLVLVENGNPTCWSE